MIGPEVAAPEIVEERRRLADAARDVLMAAGLPVWRLDNGGTESGDPVVGAAINVDPFVEGGVFIAWKASPTVVQDAIKALEANRLDDPAIELFGAITAAMIPAVAALLTTSGFTVGETDPAGFRPLQIRVIAGPDSTEHEAPIT
ncbi:hypothetical protein [Actinoplanes regularis]|uniref:hypothetical protein n=1 Tax=Actinoplanes regularis TaxID=52697 RepID=UPI001178888C|nr:hypothetical protein [Actinoplanes regularis]GIE90159.1 hypothetical protein Are01nite_66390 [Actinoplanes regularis]